MAGTTKKKVTALAKKPESIVGRNITLLGNLMRYLLAEPQILNSLPDNFELVILPEDDAEIRQYNLELLDAYGSEGKPVVLVRMKVSKEADFKRTHPSLYVPLTV